MDWVFNFRTVFFTELLAKFYSAGWTSFNTAATSYTVFLIYFSYVSRARQVWSIEQERCTECVTNVHVTVTDSENLVFTVDVCNLVNKSVFFCSLENVHCFFTSDVLSALVCFYDIICHITNSDTPSVFYVSTTFIISFAAAAARTWRFCIFAFVFVEPVRNFFYTNSFVVHFDGFFYRNNMHTNSGSSWRYNFCNLFKRKSSHMFEEVSKFWIFVDQILIHIGELARTRYEHWKNILFFMLRIFVVPFNQTSPRHVVQHFLKLFVFNARNFLELFKSFWLTDTTKLQSQFSFFICTETANSPVLWIILSNFL